MVREYEPCTGFGSRRQGSGNRAPLELMRTDTGSRIVEELLVQIDEGMFV